MARKILLADDSVTAQNMGRKILADAGYEVLTVNNGSAALKKIAEAKPELIVLDVYMPGYSGLEVCQRLKEAPDTSRIPILLTVGKLEPFKPEEARRVRADGFIVKPFEASELLSALSKLEDKIVPRGEASKPGRFARANAALDEARYDKTVAGDEDSGWKNRISFPAKKKKSADEENEDAPIYNAVNKDLRTVVEQKPSAKPQELKPQEVKQQEAKPEEETRVNLGALAPEGLPKDVTPEEIAALAAAAAQVQSKLADSKTGESKPSQPVEQPATVPQTESKANEVKIVETETKSAEGKAEPAAETKETQPVAEAAKPAEQPVAVIEQKPEEKNEHKHDEKIETPVQNPVEASKEAVPAPTSDEVIAAIASLEPEADKPLSTSFAHVSSSRETADEPVTMAVAADVSSTGTSSRWTAVSVALAPDEAALSLEQEMQKAQAASVATEVAHAAPVAEAGISPATAPEAQPVKKTAESKIEETKVVEAAPAEVQPIEDKSVSVKSEAASTSSPIETQIPDTATTASDASSNAESDLTQTASAIGNAATDAITAAVKELEAVAASYEAQKAGSSAPAATHTPEAKVEDNPIEAEIAQSQPAKESAFDQEQKQEEHKYEAPVAEIAAQAVEKISTLVVDEPKAAAPVHADEVSENKFASEVASHLAKPAEPGKPASGGMTDMVKKESELAETTAAAWASWRRIRESGDAKPASAQSAKPGSKEDSQPHDEAAMAVAAGAEKSPEEASDADSGELAAIVDSVLADLRPKIVEEISRKLGKKK